MLTREALSLVIKGIQDEPGKLTSAILFRRPIPGNQLYGMPFTTSVPLIEFALSYGYKIRVNSCSRAMTKIDMEMLEWWYNRYGTFGQSECAWAAQVGRLDILMWLRDRKTPWDKWVCTYAAEIGRLDILGKYLEVF